MHNISITHKSEYCKRLQLDRDEITFIFTQNILLLHKTLSYHRVLSVRKVHAISFMMYVIFAGNDKLCYHMISYVFNS